MSGLLAIDAPMPSPPPVQSSIAAAIARFRPTPKEVISGIAPHVFEEHGMKRRRSRSPRPSTPYKNFGNKSSPLRFSAVITWDSEGSMIFLEQDHHRSEVVVEHMSCSPLVGAPTQETHPTTPEPLRKISKARSRVFRIDVRFFKTIAIKLKPARNP